MAVTIARGESATTVERRAMVDNQIRTFDVTDQRVLQTFELIPREMFVSPEYAALAYSDASLSVKGEGQTRRMLLVPMVLARMIQGLTLAETDRVMVVASGSGYAACIVAEMCTAVVALEADETLRGMIGHNAEALGLSTIQTVSGSLTQGHAAGGPYDAILLCGAVELDPVILFQQLTPGGRLVTIQAESHEATRRSGKVVRYERVGSDVSSRSLFDATAPVLDEFRQPQSFVF